MKGGMEQWLKKGLLQFGLVKTTIALEDKLIARATELHQYKVPCIISLDITNGNPEFLKWIKNPYTTL